PRHHCRAPGLRADLRDLGSPIPRPVRQPRLPGRLRRAGPGADIGVRRALADLPEQRELTAIQAVLRAASALAAVVVAACALAFPAAAAAADPVVAAAGDIACAPNTPETPTTCH